ALGLARASLRAEGLLFIPIALPALLHLEVIVAESVAGVVGSGASHCRGSIAPCSHCRDSLARQGWRTRHRERTIAPIMHVHFIAVAGTAMGALACLFNTLDLTVSGSDTAFYPPMDPALERWGTRCMTGFDPGNLIPRPDLVIVGNVCRASSPEVV